jgi:hypothetical protein
MAIKLENASVYPSNQTDKGKVSSEPYNASFIHILPKKRFFLSENPRIPNVDPKICLELVEQYDITLQLLIQNILFCEDLKLKKITLDIFKEIVNKKDQLLYQLRLPTYKIYLSDFVGLADPRNSGGRRSTRCTPTTDRNYLKRMYLSRRSQTKPGSTSRLKSPSSKVPCLNSTM